MTEGQAVPNDGKRLRNGVRITFREGRRRGLGGTCILARVCVFSPLVRVITTTRTGPDRYVARVEYLHAACGCCCQILLLSTCTVLLQTVLLLLRIGCRYPRNPMEKGGTYRHLRPRTALPPPERWTQSRGQLHLHLHHDHRHDQLCVRSKSMFLSPSPFTSLANPG